MLAPLRVGIDVGCKRHRVGIASSQGEVLEEFDLSHDQVGFAQLFARIEHHRGTDQRPVAVAMEGYNGYARPLDQLIQQRGYTLYNVNNLKLARFKEVFPAPAKTDAIDTRKILELFQLKEHLPLAKEVLQPVMPIPPIHAKLKRLSRRRRELVQEKVRTANRLQADLQAVCPELLQLAGKVDRLWFLRFLTCRKELRQLARLQRSSLLKIAGVGRIFAAKIQHWQEKAHFSAEVDYVGPMIQADALRMLDLVEQIKALDGAMEKLAQNSAMAQRLRSIPGFGPTCAAELTGEIGALQRFASEASLALYLGMCPLSDDSGQCQGSRQPRQVNGRAKAAMMVAVARHMEQVPQSRAYYDKKRAQGKKHNQAIRALGRQLVRVMYAMLSYDRDYELREVTPL